MATRTKLKPIPAGTPNGYITLAELTRIRPAEDDLTVDGCTVRLRGLTSGEIQQIRNLCYRPPAAGGHDGMLNLILNAAFGLVHPDLKAHEDLTAARLIVEGMPAVMLAAISDKIMDLTNEPTPVTERGDEVGEPDAAAPESSEPSAEA